jgi:hypothetical protein
MPDDTSAPRPDYDTVVGREFAAEHVQIDGTHFEDCTFDGCTFVYRGGPAPDFVRCTFAAPHFVFEGPAQRTLQLMSAIYDGIDERIIEKTFDQIRGAGA